MHLLRLKVKIKIKLNDKNINLKYVKNNIIVIQKIFFIDT